MSFLRHFSYFFAVSFYAVMLSHTAAAYFNFLSGAAFYSQYFLPLPSVSFSALFGFVIFLFFFLSYFLWRFAMFGRYWLARRDNPCLTLVLASRWKCDWGIEVSHAYSALQDAFLGLCNKVQLALQEPFRLEGKMTEIEALCFYKQFPTGI